MRAIAKVYLMLAIFFGILLSYLLLLTIDPTSSLCRYSTISQSLTVNCMLLVFFSLLISFVVAQFIDSFYKKLIEIKWRNSKLGRVLVSEGYVTEKDLMEALGEQSLRMGEILVQAGRITREQLEQALDHQKKHYRKLGEILRDLAFSTDEDIDWALNSSELRLGEIFLKKGVITDYDLNSSLALQRYGPNWVQSAWNGKITIH